MKEWILPGGRSSETPTLSPQLPLNIADPYLPLPRKTLAKSLQISSRLLFDGLIGWRAEIPRSTVEKSESSLQDS
jgi:hypothetical protein